MYWSGSWSKQILIQFGRFALVGLLATLTHLGTLAFGVEMLHGPVLAASTAGFVLAVMVSYVLNCHWTFEAARGHIRHLPKYVLVCITGFMLNTILILVTVELMHWWYIYGQLAALAVVPVCNFLLNRHWVFGGRKTDETTCQE